MNVIIKSMKLPENCMECKFYHNEEGCVFDCNTTIREWNNMTHKEIQFVLNTRHKDCPLEDEEIYLYKLFEDIRNEILSLKGDNFSKKFYLKIIEKHISGKEHK